MNITVKIRRYNPETDHSFYFQTYTVSADPTERILDVLMRLKRDADGTLNFRKSCAHGVCGSDAMRINDKDRLACKTLVKDVAQSDQDVVTIEPMRHFEVLRDLIVDQYPFLDKYRSVKPFLINNEPVAEKERIQSPEERKAFDDPTNCILCAACISACPVMGENPQFLGPGVIVLASRFNKDSRDRGFEARLPQLDAENGVWPCRNFFECTKACPRSIKVTKLINETKRRIQQYHEKEES